MAVYYHCQKCGLGVPPSTLTSGSFFRTIIHFTRPCACGGEIRIPAHLGAFAYVNWAFRLLILPCLVLVVVLLGVQLVNGNFQVAELILGPLLACVVAFMGAFMGAFMVGLPLGYVVAWRKGAPFAFRDVASITIVLLFWAGTVLFIVKELFPEISR